MRKKPPSKKKTGSKPKKKNTPIKGKPKIGKTGKKSSRGVSKNQKQTPKPRQSPFKNLSDTKKLEHIASDKRRSPFNPRTPKKYEVRYRDKKGRLVKPENIKGKKFVKFEVWRFKPKSFGAPSTGWKKIDFGKRWEPDFVKRKHPMTNKQFYLVLKRRFAAHKIKVQLREGEIIVVETES